VLFFGRRKKKRVCVVGLDGVPFGLLKRLAESSAMPRTAAILRGGGLRQMRASLPPISSVSWSSFMTGANPGEHGIFGFTEVEPDTYRLKFPMFGDLAVPTLWERLGENGKRCAVINQPATYPARQVPGALVSGFVALDLAKSVWPKDHLRALEEMRYRIDVDTRKAREDPDGLLDDLHATLETRRRAAAYFWERERWDYFQVVVTGTDRLHHFLWRAVEQADDPRHDRALAYYHAVDELIGEMWDRFHQGQSADREGEGVLLLSDHGFCELRQEVKLNAWLREQGYLDYESEAPKSVAEIAEGTRAFALDPGRIYLNVRGRFGKGCVEPEAAPALREELVARLKEWSHEGERVVTHIFTREEAFHGPRVELGPDLVVLARRGLDLKGTTRGDEVFTATYFQGMHTWDDAFVWSRMPVPDQPEISDLGGVIEEWLRA